MLLSKHFYVCSFSHVMLCFLLRTSFSKNVRTWDLKHCTIHHLNTLSGVIWHFLLVRELQRVQDWHEQSVCDSLDSLSYSRCVDVTTSYL